MDGELTWTGEVPVGLPTGGDPLAALRTVVEELHSEPLPGLPPLTGGMVGYLGYDVVRRLERLPELAVDDLRIPELVMLLATDLAAVDHHEGTITLIANAINWDATDERVDEAYDDAVRPAGPDDRRAGRARAVHGRGLPARPSRGSPAGAARPSTTPPWRAAKEQIRAGEAFQIVVSQRFETDCAADPLDVYRVLRATNPSPYMYLLRLRVRRPASRSTIVGSSPEALVTVRDGQVTTHPIAGTRLARRHRGGGPAAGEGPAHRREGARRARDARRPRPQRPGPGVRAGHGQGAQTSSPSSATATSCTWCPR